MPTVKLKVSGFLPEKPEVAWAQPEGTLIVISEGETISDLVYRLAARNDVFRKIIFGKENLELGANVIVVLNGMLVNLHDRSESLLREGDEVVLLPVVGGG
jgi:molybdopterin converting factor small subunit